MKLSSLQLEAFFETAKLRSFSKAAGRLGITQSALSQRVANLEDVLRATLLIRDPAGPILTEAGEQLLRYCQVNDSLEQEILGRLQAKPYGGMVRVAGFSSVLRSAIIPALAPFLRAHPDVQCQFRGYEVVELPGVLRNAEADFAVLDYHLERSGFVEHLLGQEEYVVIESARHDSPKDLYLDHGPHDDATEMFFRAQPDAPKNYRRSFMGDVYGIINGVELGLGRAVMSKHLLKGNGKVRIKKGYKRYHRDVTLHYFSQPYYSDLHRAVVSQLKEHVPRFL